MPDRVVSFFLASEHCLHSKVMVLVFVLQVCYYRDKNSINKFQVATVTEKGVDICEPFALETNWDFKVKSVLALAQCMLATAHTSCQLACLFVLCILYHYVAVLRFLLQELLGI